MLDAALATLRKRAQGKYRASIRCGCIATGTPSTAIFYNHEVDIHATTRSSKREILDRVRLIQSAGRMTSDGNPDNLRALQSDNPKKDREPGDGVNLFSLTLAVMSGIALLAITIACIWK
jgi:hypothetical protein